MKTCLNWREFEIASIKCVEGKSKRNGFEFEITSNISILLAGVSSVSMVKYISVPGELLLELT